MSVGRVLRRLTYYLGAYHKARLFRRGLAESRATDRWTEVEIRAYHDRRLVALVRDAATNIPFYRELYERAGVAVARFSGVADLPRLPTITKADLLRHGPQMIRPGVSELRIVRHTTGGSTGTIATLASQRGIASYENGCIYALWSRIGVRRGDRIVTLRGALLDGGRRLYQRDLLENRLTISTYHLKDETVDEIVQLIDEFGPRWLHVYPSALTLLANILQRTGRRLTVTPQGILCGSEAVYPWQLDMFRGVFGCRVYSHYGHGELALLGGWCEGAETYHFLPNHGYLELLDDDGRPVIEPGQTGEITGTGYINWVMPLIRYRTGDYGAWDAPGPCPACGRAHQRLARIDGRGQEYLTLADGTKFPLTNINALHGMFFAHIYRFQFLQDVPGRATLRVVPAVELTPQRLAEIRAAFSYLGPLGLELDIQPVAEIPLTRSGKQRLVVTSEDLARG
jgi:phenylacetate-CoA ligase